MSGAEVGVGVAGSSLGAGTVGAGEAVPLWGASGDGPGDPSAEDDVG